MNWKTFDEVPPFEKDLLLASNTYFIPVILEYICALGLYFKGPLKYFYLKDTTYTHWCEIVLPEK